MCDSVAFTHLQCGLEPRNLDGTDLGSCWCLERARRFTQRELLLPYAWKSLLSITCLVFTFLLWPTLLTCSVRASMTDFPSSKSLDCPLSSLWTILPWCQESTSQVLWRVCHSWFGFGMLSLGCGALSHCLLFFWSFCCFFFYVAFSMRRTLSIPDHHDLTHLDGDFWAPLGLLEVSVIGRHWSVCDPVVFAHLQCGLEARNLDATNLGSCWRLQRARRFGQRELSLPYAWKSLLSVAGLVIPFSLLWPTLLACSGRASLTATLPS